MAEESREQWRWSWREDLSRDLRCAARSLVRDPGFALTAVLSQALGIGFNTFALLPSRAGAGLPDLIGTLGLTLAPIGLYGVLTNSVSRRIPEIGLHIALGARRVDVLRLVLA